MKFLATGIIATLFATSATSRNLQSDFCKTWNPATHKCTSCYYHYWLDNGVCRQVSDQCATWNVNTGACTSCFYHSYLSGGQCYPVSDQCATWDINTGKCTSCWSGATLQPDGTCTW